eukprot:TRINITY_DN63766_c0_g1_i1.p1 TRINITY_DN63766_c0_g1~~TRINITY_DN63766_c0_g1_i1.p1  ORF type:complete len:161 (-),score=53.82 TRINITY_DN63766_c0_g1_i1:18-464(-)
MLRSLVGSEMCIRDSLCSVSLGEIEKFELGETTDPHPHRVKEAQIFDAATVLQGASPVDMEIPDGVCLHQLLRLASVKLGISAKRIFSTNGAEFSLWWSSAHVQHGETLVFSAGQAFVPHTMLGVGMAIGMHSRTFIPPLAPDSYLIN